MNFVKTSVIIISMFALAKVVTILCGMSFQEALICVLVGNIAYLITKKM